MAIKLNTFKVDEGTAESPFILSDKEVKTLYDIALEDIPNKEVKGYVTTESRKIKAYYKHILETNFPKLVVDAVAIEDAWTVTLLSSRIQEGNSTQFIVSNLPLSTLSCEVGTINLSLTSGIYSEADVRKNLTVDLKNGVISYAAPTSNAGWTAVIELKFYPSYTTNPQESDYKKVYLTVQAIAITDITVAVADAVEVGGITDVNVSITPTTNTKGDNLSIEYDVNAGQIVSSAPLTATFVAPSVETEVTLVTRAYLFGDKENPAFVKTNNIVVANPYLQVNITTDDELDDSPINDVKVTVTAPDGTTHELGNGERIEVKGDGTETYTISIPSVYGYKVEGAKSVTPTSLSTIVNIAYTVIVPDVYVVYDDGFEESYQTIVDRNYKLDETRNAVGVAVVTADCAFIRKAETLKSNLSFKNNRLMNEVCTKVDNQDIALTFFNGKEITERKISYAQGNNIDISATGSEYFYECISGSIVINGEERKSYEPALGEVKAYADNYVKIHYLFSYCFFVTPHNWGNWPWGAGLCSGTIKSDSSVWRLDIFIRENPSMEHKIGDIDKITAANSGAYSDNCALRLYPYN